MGRVLLRDFLCGLFFFDCFWSSLFDGSGFVWKRAMVIVSGCAARVGCSGGVAGSGDETMIAAVKNAGRPPKKRLANARTICPHESIAYALAALSL